MLVGILALQGDVREHCVALTSLGCATRLIKQPSEVEGIDALVLPGGESTTMSLLLDLTGLREPLSEWTRNGRPTLGTCAGLVLLADEMTDGRVNQRGLGGLAITVQRNGYGRQRFSFETTVDAPSLGQPFEAVFIRAPRIARVGPEVHVLGVMSRDDASDPEPVIVEAGGLIGCAFHPELAGDLRLHERLISRAEG